MAKPGGRLRSWDQPVCPGRESIGRRVYDPVKLATPGRFGIVLAPHEHPAVLAKAVLHNAPFARRVARGVIHSFCPVAADVFMPARQVRKPPGNTSQCTARAFAIDKDINGRRFGWSAQIAERRG
jgi:hypothetical protein